MSRRRLAMGLVLVMALVSLSCAPGNERWDQEINPGQTAGFWVGIWHGLIIVVTFVVSLFTKEVGLYEMNNTGWPYNLGFLIGLFALIRGIIGHGMRRRKVRKYDWDKIGHKVEERVHRGVKAFLDETEREEKRKEWEEIASKIEEKIKRALKEWADKE